MNVMRKSVNETTVVIYKPNGQEKVYNRVVSLGRDDKTLHFVFKTCGPSLSDERTEAVMTSLPYLVVEKLT